MSKKSFQKSPVIVCSSFLRGMKTTSGSDKRKRKHFGNCPFITLEFKETYLPSDETER